MATLRKLVDDLYATLNINADDSNVDRRSIKWWIKNKRSTLIYNQLVKGVLHSNNYKQTIPCLELELVDAYTDTCCIDLRSGCQVLRSVQKLPTRLNIRGYEDIQVRPLNVFQYKLNHVYDREKWTTSGNGRFNSKDIYTVIINDYLYVKAGNKSISKLLGKYLTIEGIFDDPEECRAFTECNTNRPCFSEDETYPIEDWMIDIMKRDIIASDLRIILSTVEDKSNDSEDSNESNVSNSNRAS